MAKQLKTFCQGAKKNEGKTWFAQLADKSKQESKHAHNVYMCNVLVGKSIKTSVCWAMNCGRCRKTLLDLITNITNITKHYQVLEPKLYKQCANVCLHL